MSDQTAKPRCRRAIRLRSRCRCVYPCLLAFVALEGLQSLQAQTVTFHAFAEGKATTDTTSLSVPVPAGTVAGDLLIAAVATDGNNEMTLAPASGSWTLISRRTQTAVTFGVWWKIAGASEPSSHSFTWSANEQAYGWIMRFSGHDGTNPIHAVSESGSSATLPSSPSVTTTVPNTLILRLGGFDGSAVTIDDTGLAGHTTITMDRSSTTSLSAASGGAGFVQQPAAGSSGPSNFQLTTTEEYRTVTVAIAPFTCSTGADCADGNPCTDDVCSGGVCSNPNNTASCDDGDPCTTGDTCSNGVCVSGGPVDCSGAGNDCNTASCDPAGAPGNCDILTPVLDGTSCDDGDPCTTGETCTGGICGGGAPVDCSGAGDPCNTASCDTLGAPGNCDILTPVADGTACNDGLFCTATDTCQAGTCTGIGNACPGQVCDETNDVCVDCLVNADCDDANPCTTDTCTAGTCAHQHTGQITVNLALQALSAAVSRDVTFVITNCAGGADVRSQTVSFDATGSASVLLTAVDAGSEWISAQEGHTLRRLAPLTFTSCAATVSMTGASALLAGDFQGGVAVQDNIVEITDFSILASNWNQAIDPTLATGADATGDGVQSTADFTAIQANFFTVGDAVDGCALAVREAAYAGRRRTLEPHQLIALARSGATRIPTSRLAIPNARRADMNADGVVDVRDIRLFARQHRLRLRPDFERKLKLIERTETRSLRR